MSERCAFLEGSFLASYVEKMTGWRYLTSNAGTMMLVTVSATFTSWVRLLILSCRNTPSYLGPLIVPIRFSADVSHPAFLCGKILGPFSR
uniref:Uncharacterized protein n=1 Tax=Arundo donax TaxID=35708 RepID=A0A0A9G5M6_ARUDO